MIDDTELNSFSGKSPLNEVARCGMFTNAQGDVLIIHDKPVDSQIQWIEYDPVQKKLSLILENGLPQDLGLKFDEKTSGNLLNSRDVQISNIIDGKIQNTQTVGIVIQNY